ncbi:hypothetical protein [Chitinophaga polysaccharea]|uniref:hypothetical protein n=1 Tax=Chitinophaga polysaccharea TaxID=1293035 RepID=UPI00115BF9F9|nr:hypothetical protein [Chitinophaga polysaccharea]
MPENFRSYQSAKRSENKVQTEQLEKEPTLTEWNENLVPDPYFASILNDKLEVQVENTVVKITKYGTFLCMPNKLSRVYAIIKDLDKDPQSVIRKMGPQTENFQPEHPSRVVQIDTGVVYMSSSDYNRPSRIITNPSDAAPEEDDNKYVRPSRIAGEGNGEQNLVGPLPQSTYDAFPSYDFDAKTWAGSLIQDAFGRTKPHFDYFDDKHRVKVNFYNVNFGVYAAAGINVKMQTKGWTGIWRELATEEMRLGWDGLILKFKMPNMPQPNIPKIDFGKLQIGSINFPIESITIGGNNITSDVKDALNGVIEGQLRNTLKTIWDSFIETSLLDNYQLKKIYQSFQSCI